MEGNFYFSNHVEKFLTSQHSLPVIDKILSNHNNHKYLKRITDEMRMNNSKYLLEIIPNDLYNVFEKMKYPLHSYIQHISILGEKIFARCSKPKLPYLLRIYCIPEDYDSVLFQYYRMGYTFDIHDLYDICCLTGIELTMKYLHYFPLDDINLLATNNYYNDRFFNEKLFYRCYMEFASKFLDIIELYAVKSIPLFRKTCLSYSLVTDKKGVEVFYEFFKTNNDFFASYYYYYKKSSIENVLKKVYDEYIEEDEQGNTLLTESEEDDDEYMDESSDLEEESDSGL